MNKEMEERLLDAVNQYYTEEFGEDTVISKIPDNNTLGLAYTTYDFGDDYERDIQVDFSLALLSYLNYIDNDMVLNQKIDELEEFVEYIRNATFDEVIEDCISKGYEIFGGREDV